MIDLRRTRKGDQVQVFAPVLTAVQRLADEVGLIPGHEADRLEIIVNQRIQQVGLGAVSQGSPDDIPIRRCA